MQYVGAVESLPTQVVSVRESFYVPGRSRYESRDIMLKPFLPWYERVMDKIDRKKTAEQKEKRPPWALRRGRLQAWAASRSARS